MLHFPSDGVEHFLIPFTFFTMAEKTHSKHYFFIADVHLETMKDPRGFWDMLDGLDQLSEDYAIVFLGDIFDLWFALKNYEGSLQKNFADWCLKAGEKREIFFVEGNHEFYV